MLKKVDKFSGATDLEHKLAGVEPLEFISNEECDFDTLSACLDIPK